MKGQNLSLGEFNLRHLFGIYHKQNINSMSNLEINVSSKPVKQLCSDTASVMEAFDQKGKKYYAKIISIERSQNLGYDQSLQFNEEILQDISQYPFKQNFLDIKTRISNEDCIGFITQPYECNLKEYVLKQTVGEKEMMKIFDQIVRAVYSLIMSGYWHRNIRAEHFVKSGETWKMESLVLNEDYSKANGLINQYLWSSKHEPPQFIAGKQYSDEEYNQMTVWNLGCILLHLVVSNHKLSNTEILNKFKGKPFTFQAIGIKSDKIEKLSQKVKDLLASLLHHNPKQRMKLSQVFQNKNISVAVAEHAIKNKQSIPASKIVTGRSIINSKINFQSRNVLNDISKTMNDKQKQRQKILTQSKLSSVIDEQDFFDNLQELSVKIPAKAIGSSKKEQFEDIEQLMKNKNSGVRKALQLYKSYLDQSELLVYAIQNIDKLDFHMFKQESQVKQIRLLTKYAVLFVSLNNLHNLAQGFNQNRNILDLDGDQFTDFQNSSEYSSFQRYVNFKRTQRGKELQNIKSDIALFKKKNLCKDEKISSFIQKDYKKATFSQIKTAYRFIVKFSYDAISQQYNKNKTLQLSQRAMFVTYCLTIDKLYIKEHIPDNFKYYFQWINKPANNYVPLNNFKDYILKAPKEMLIENSRYILKKYYNI